ncbi:hypothetical protein [Staphylococcus sp. Marseille-Q1834]|uniref:hypothetical protein n=1 Tax=Staphylococcus sp. Marseille-Q1834 TaxID=2866594 RepID=UPI0012B9A451|nr:hypothetical protein [Staphylococcus sp. Marseille-Q1834]
MNPFINVIFAVLVTNIVLLTIKQLRTKNIIKGIGLELTVSIFLSAILMLVFYLIYMLIMRWK